jgi:glycerate kinase
MGGTVERPPRAVSVVSVRVLAAVDKFRGTATARQVADTIASAAERLGHECDRAPVSDGGEGWLDAFGGPNRRTIVSGPLGDPVEAQWRLQGDTAVIEMARASGIDLVGGVEGNDPMAASTAGTGELIDAALDAGARRIVVGLGGSATTDGGFGAVRAIRVPDRLRRVELLVACDVTTTFVDAARVFAPQKGASPAQVQLLTGRLERLGQVYEEQYRVDVRDAPGAGAAGGLAGGLLAIGAELVAGFDLLADELELPRRVAASDLVVTGEGFLDAQSFDGKVVGGVARLAGLHERPVVAIAGDVYDDATSRIEAYSLVERFGDERARTHTLECIDEVMSELLKNGAVSRRSSSSRSGSSHPPAT